MNKTILIVLALVLTAGFVMAEGQGAHEGNGMNELNESRGGPENFTGRMEGKIARFENFSEKVQARLELMKRKAQCNDKLRPVRLRIRCCEE